MIYCSAARHWSNVLRDCVAQAFLEARRDAMVALVVTPTLDCVKNRIVCDAALCYPDGIIYTQKLPFTFRNASRVIDLFRYALGIPASVMQADRAALHAWATPAPRGRSKPLLFRRPAGIILFDPLASEMLLAGDYYALDDYAIETGDDDSAAAISGATDNISAVSALLRVARATR